MIMYIMTPLEGNAHRMISPYTVNDQMKFNTIKELQGILDCAFDDPYRQATTEQELAMLKQGTSESLPYFADFQCIMAKLQLDLSVTAHRHARWRKAVEASGRQWKVARAEKSR